MTDKEAFEAFHSEVPKGELASRFPYSRIVWQAAWQAATAAERERCAKVCETFGAEPWAVSKECADAIRALPEGAK